jgi:hypothetical protein
MNPPNTKQSPSTMSTVGALSRSMSAAPHSIYVSSGTTRRLENRINQRIGLVTPERLMNAAKHKQRYEASSAAAEAAAKARDPLRAPPARDIDLPDLGSQANAQLLNEVALDVLRNSNPGESIERLADKVVVICTLLHENPMLDKNLVIPLVNNVFMNWTDNTFIEEAVSRTMSRIRAMKHKGGFHKKTKCRGTSKKSKYRKSRSRR